MFKNAILETAMKTSKTSISIYPFIKNVYIWLCEHYRNMTFYYLENMKIVFFLFSIYPIILIKNVTWLCEL